MSPKTRVGKGDIMPKKKKQEDIIKFQAEINEIKQTIKNTKNQLNNTEFLPKERSQLIKLEIKKKISQWTLRRLKES